LLRCHRGQPILSFLLPPSRCQGRIPARAPSSARSSGPPPGRDLNFRRHPAARADLLRLRPLPGRRPRPSVLRQGAVLVRRSSARAASQLLPPSRRQGGSPASALRQGRISCAARLCCQPPGADLARADLPPPAQSATRGGYRPPRPSGQPPLLSTCAGSAAASTNRRPESSSSRTATSAPSLVAAAQLSFRDQDLRQLVQIGLLWFVWFQASCST
jgi:hypothetical protein